MAVGQERYRASVLVLAGGGIDSTVCMYQLAAEGYRCRGLHVDYGQPASSREWDSVQRAGQALSIGTDHLTLRPAIHCGGPEVTGRNAAFVSLGLLHARAEETLLCLGVHAGTPFFDCSPSFAELMERLVAEQTDSRVRLVTPLIALTKRDVLARARALNVPVSHTYSCQRGTLPACGECHSCLDRKALGC